MTQIILGLVIALQTLGALSVVAAVGKERKPITPGLAVGAVILSGSTVAGLVYVLLS